jgi:hypothetical protein
MVLRNGASFSGVVREQGDRVVVEMDAGVMSFRKIDVREIVRSDDPLHEFERRRAAATDARSMYETALWGRERGLAGRSTELLRKVIETDPDHEGARKLLGFERVAGRWMEGDELMAARGFVRHDGRWVPRETAEKAREQETLLKIESDRRATEEKIAGMRREVDLAKVALERERLDRERRDQERWWSWAWAPAPLSGCVPTGSYAIRSTYLRAMPPAGTGQPVPTPPPGRPPAGTLKP